MHIATAHDLLQTSSVLDLKSKGRCLQFFATEKCMSRHQLEQQSLLRSFWGCIWHILHLLTAGNDHKWWGIDRACKCCLGMELQQNTSGAIGATHHPCNSIPASNLTVQCHTFKSCIACCNWVWTLTHAARGTLDGPDYAISKTCLECYEFAIILHDWLLLSCWAASCVSC